MIMKPLCVYCITHQSFKRMTTNAKWQKAVASTASNVAMEMVALIWFHRVMLWNPIGPDEIRPVTRRTKLTMWPTTTAMSAIIQNHPDRRPAQVLASKSLMSPGVALTVSKARLHLGVERVWWIYFVYFRVGDYGTFTLLSQDSEGGLEAKLPGSTKWKRVGHLPGAILINTGEILSIWSRKRYPALLHRVIIPEQESVRVRGRHSMAFFCHPGVYNKHARWCIMCSICTNLDFNCHWFCQQTIAHPFSLLIFQPLKHQFVIKRKNLKDVHSRLLKISKYTCDYNSLTGTTIWE